jgi:hypothetical protein
MKKALVLLVAGTFGLGSTLSLAEPAVVKQPLVSKAAPSVKTRKATRLDDAQLDKVSAGGAEVINISGMTIITNPGNVSRQNVKSHHLHLTFIN